LRTDLSFGVRAGGSVVVSLERNTRAANAGPPILVTTSPVPTLRPTPSTSHRGAGGVLEFPGAAALALNDVVVDDARRGERP
jgi:hypothetical protein